MIIHEIELAYNIIRESFGTKLFTNAEYAHLIKRDFDIPCTERDIEVIQSANLDEMIEDMELQYKNLGLV